MVMDFRKGHLPVPSKVAEIFAFKMGFWGFSTDPNYIILSLNHRFMSGLFHLRLNGHFSGWLIFEDQ